MFRKVVLLLMLTGLTLAIGVPSAGGPPILTIQLTVDIPGTVTPNPDTLDSLKALGVTCTIDPTEKEKLRLLRMNLFLKYRDNNTNGIPDSGDDILELGPKQGILHFQWSGYFKYTCGL